MPVEKAEVTKVSKDEDKERVVVAEYDDEQTKELTVDQFFRDVIQAMFSADEDTVDTQIRIENTDGTAAEIELGIHIKSIDGKENK